MKSPMHIPVCVLLGMLCSIQAVRSDVPEVVLVAMNAAMSAASLEPVPSEDLYWVVRDRPKRFVLCADSADLVEQEPIEVLGWRDADWGKEMLSIGPGLLVIGAVHETPRGLTLLLSATVYGPDAADTLPTLGLAEHFNSGWFEGVYKGSYVDAAVYCTREFALAPHEQSVDFRAAIESWLDAMREVRTRLAGLPDVRAFYRAVPEPDTVIGREPIEGPVRAPAAAPRPRQVPRAGPTPRPSVVIPPAPTARPPTTLGGSCPVCRGLGVITCRDCKGQGSYFRTRGIISRTTTLERCARCNGSGVTPCFMRAGASTWAPQCQPLSR